MNRLVLTLPKSLLRKYVLDNFEKLSLEDFFSVVNRKIDIPSYYYEKNKTLSSGSQVLGYALSKDIKAINYFQESAFNDDIIEMITNSDIDPYSINFEKFSIFLRNYNFIKMMIQKHSVYSLLKIVSSEIITDEIIKILEDKSYIPNEEDIIKLPIILQSEKLMIRAVEKNPNLILILDNLSEKLVNVALKKGFIPKKEHFISKPEFRLYERLLEKAFEYDCSVIAFYA